MKTNHERSILPTQKNEEYWEGNNENLQDWLSKIYLVTNINDNPNKANMLKNKNLNLL